MQRLSNFARIVRRYFDSAANISLDDQETQLEKNQNSCTALKDSCKLAECSTTAIPLVSESFVLSKQKNLLQGLIDSDSKEEHIPSNSWAVIGFNVLCKKYNCPEHCLPVTKIPPPATDDEIEKEAKKTFKYMYSGKWMSPTVWERYYNKALKKASLTEGSKISKAFNDAKNDYLKKKDKSKK